MGASLLAVVALFALAGRRPRTYSLEAGKSYRYDVRVNPPLRGDALVRLALDVSSYGNRLLHFTPDRVSYINPAEDDVQRTRGQVLTTFEGSELVLEGLALA